MKKGAYILTLLLLMLPWVGINAQREPKPKVISYTVGNITFDMVLVEGGKFMMGADFDTDVECYNDEMPRHSVELHDFYIGKIPVTQELWKAVMHTNPSHYRAYKNPVENVSWYDCMNFVDVLNHLLGESFRLPTEAEWEYAARGGRESEGYIYAGSNKLDEVAWYEKNTKDVGRPMRAGVLMPNELGIYDMSGNVWEWCRDWYGPYDKSPRKNPESPSGEDSFKVLRGGCDKGVSRSCRVTNRSSSLPEHAGFHYGFRLVIYK